MSAILSVDYHRLAYLGGNYTFKAGNHIALRHPADIAHFTVSGGILVKRMLKRQIGEITSALNHADKAVSRFFGV